MAVVVGMLLQLHSLLVVDSNFLSDHFEQLLPAASMHL
jgi:hypothetical protein